MKFGMPNLVECENLEACAVLANELGLNFIEVNMSFPEYTPDAFDIENALRISRQYNVFYTIHADENLNPFDFNPKVSDCYFDVMRGTLKVAKAINAKVINLHLLKGIYVTLPGKVILLTDVYRENYLEKVRKLIIMCEEELSGTDIKIAIENVDSNAFTEAQLEALKLFLSSDAFGLTLDTGHECKLKYADSHVFEKYPEKLIHMHLHDCEGGAPHMPLGSGEVDIDNKIQAFKGDTCLLEVKTVSGLIESVEYLKNRGIYNDK